MADPIADGNNGGKLVEGDFQGKVEEERRKLAEADQEKQSISDRAAAEDAGNEEEAQLAIPTLEGDKPFALAGLGPRGMAVESEVSVMSAAVPVSGLLDPDKRGQLLVAYAPASYTYVPVRENGKVARYKLRQQVRPDHVIAANTLSAVEAIVMNVIQNGVSAEDVTATVERTLREIQAAAA